MSVTGPISICEPVLGPCTTHSLPAMHASDSEQSSDDCCSGNDPRRSGSVPNLLSKFVATSEWLWNRFGFGNRMHSRERIRGAGRAVGFHTPAQPSKRRRLPSVSPVKRRQVTFSELDFDGVERFIRFPCNPQAWFECQCCALCSNLRVC